NKKLRRVGLAAPVGGGFSPGQGGDDAVGDVTGEQIGALQDEFPAADGGLVAGHVLIVPTVHVALHIQAPRIEIAGDAPQNRAVAAADEVGRQADGDRIVAVKLVNASDQDGVDVKFVAQAHELVGVDIVHVDRIAGENFRARFRGYGHHLVVSEFAQGTGDI